MRRTLSRPPTTATSASGLCIVSQSQEYIDLKYDQTWRGVGVMSLSFPESETNVLYVGTDALYARCTFSVRKSVPSLASQHGVESAANLALTSSFDWSIKFWMVTQYQSLVLSMDMSRPRGICRRHVCSFQTDKVGPCIHSDTTPRLRHDQVCLAKASTPRASRGATAETTPESHRGNVQLVLHLQ